MVDRPPWPARELLRAWPSARSRPWRLAVRWGKRRGAHQGSVLGLIQDGEASQRWLDDGNGWRHKGTDEVAQGGVPDALM
jgi:hypothetical protein